MTILVTGVAQPIFPEGCEVRAQVRRDVRSSEVLAELTTEGGELVRLSDDSISLRIPASATALARDDTVVIDFVRTDVTPELYLFVSMTVPVIAPVTRGRSS